ncbi:MAG TPA: efflux RND transporter periplasmic adaptor subunit [Longimicrobiales bacterium]|nr:efflux RND transporter periplasmic adaptor subunit [Longimicrobiales bacterium]
MKKNWMKHGTLAVIVLAAMTAVYATTRPPAEMEAAAIEYGVVERRDMEVTAEAAGLIEPIRLVEVKSKASGEIIRLHVETGDVVRRGDLLGEVDPRDVRNAYAQAAADLEVAQARAATAESQRRRSEELRAANVITEQEFENAKLEQANAQAQLVKARVNLELAEERMNDVTIRAPIDGVIIGRDVEEGSIIQSASQNISGGTTIFLMADLNEMQVRTLVSETDLGKIQPGMPSRVSVEAYPGRIFPGTVTKIEPQAVVEQNVTMFPVLVHLNNSDGSLKPGMNGEVIVEVARRADAITIPNASVVGTRDAAAAAAMFGINEEQLRTMMRGGQGSQPAGNGGQNRPAAEGAPAEGAPAEGAQVAARPEGGAPPAARQAQGGPPQGMQGGMARGGAGRAGGAAGAAAGQDVRPGVVFVQTETGVEPRSVMLGVNDWDYTEVLRGVEPGEHVILISVARLQQQQQDMLNRMRQNTSIMPGGSGPGMRR